MTQSRLAGSALLAVGVIVIVIGGLLILGGFNQQKMTQAWDDERSSACLDAVYLPADASREEINRAFLQCEGPFRNNPYAGWRGSVFVGLVVAFLGGVIAYFGTRQG